MAFDFIRTLILTVAAITLTNCLQICPAVPPNAASGQFKVCEDENYCRECPRGYTHCIREESSDNNRTCSICMRSDQIYNKAFFKIRDCFKRPKETKKRIALGEDRIVECLNDTQWKTLRKEKKVSEVSRSMKDGYATFLFKAENTVGFECSHSFQNCNINGEMDLDKVDFAELSDCMNCSCPQGITMTEERNHVKTTLGFTVKDIITIIIYCVVGGGLIMFIIQIVIFMRMKKVKMNNAERNPEYGLYSDPDYVSEIVNENENYASTGVYEENTTQVHDKNIYYE